MTTVCPAKRPVADGTEVEPVTKRAKCKEEEGGDAPDPYRATRTITMTGAEVGENHIGMEKIGQEIPDKEALHLADMQRALRRWQDNFGGTGKIVWLNAACLVHTEEKGTATYVDKNGRERTVDGDAYVLILDDFVDTVLRAHDMSLVDAFNEAAGLPWDAHYLCTRRNKVLHKNARANNIVASFDQEPDYAAGKGTVVSFERTPVLSILKIILESIFGRDIPVFEGNNYAQPDASTASAGNGIGFHNDNERKVVIAIRLGCERRETHPMWFQYRMNHKDVGKRAKVELRTGDVYAMSLHATGRKKPSTLQPYHATGHAKFLKPKARAEYSVVM